MTKSNHRNYNPTQTTFSDRVVLVTGATAGIGRAVSEKLVKLGATTILLGRDARKLDQLHQDLLPLGPECAVANIDFSRAQGEEYVQLIDQIEQRFGRIDALLHNASMLGDRSPIEHYDIGVWQKVMHVNVNAQFILTRCLLPLLRKSNNASIVFTTSGVGNKGKPHWGAYAASKFATEGLAQVLAAELANSNIRVNCINPGRTRTSMRAHAYPGEDPETVPLPEEILPSYLWLLGPDSTGVTGQRLDCQD